MKKIILPKGLFFNRTLKDEYGDYTIYLIADGVSCDTCGIYCLGKGGHVIGHIRLDRIGNKRYKTHSDLDIEYHNKGLGTLLYAKAIKFCLSRGYKISSSGYSSSPAKRVWEGKTIRSFFKIRKRWLVHGRGNWANRQPIWYVKSMRS